MTVVEPTRGRSLDTVLGITAAGAAVWLLQLLSHPLFRDRATLGGGEVPSLGAVWLPLLAACLLLAAALAWPTLRSALHGRRLVGALVLAVFGVHVVLVAVEAALFLDVLTASDLLLGVTVETVLAVVLAAVLTVTLGRRPRPRRSAPAAGPFFGAWGWTWRLAVCSLAYLVLYVTAGMMIWERVRPFYEAIGLDVAPQVIFPTQIVRGALYVLFTLPLLRSLVMRRWQASLAVAVAFPILAGVAALIIPNPLLPDWVARWHLLEIGWSNFVYGALVGFLFWNPRAGVEKD